MSSSSASRRFGRKIFRLSLLLSKHSTTISMTRSQHHSSVPVRPSSVLYLSLALLHSSRHQNPVKYPIAFRSDLLVALWVSVCVCVCVSVCLHRRTVLLSPTRYSRSSSISVNRWSFSSAKIAEIRTPVSRVTPNSCFITFSSVD